MSEEDYESTAFIRNGGNVPSRDSLTCPEGNPYITVTLHYCYLTLLLPYITVTLQLTRAV